MDIWSSVGKKRWGFCVILMFARWRARRSFLVGAVAVLAVATCCWKCADARGGLCRLRGSVLQLRYCCRCDSVCDASEKNWPLHSPSHACCVFLLFTRFTWRLGEVDFSHCSLQAAFSTMIWFYRRFDCGWREIVEVRGSFFVSCIEDLWSLNYGALYGPYWRFFEVKVLFFPWKLFILEKNVCVVCKWRMLTPFKYHVDSYIRKIDVFFTFLRLRRSLCILQNRDNSLAELG